MGPRVESGVERVLPPDPHESVLLGYGCHVHGPPNAPLTSDYILESDLGFNQLLSRLVDVAELFYRLLSEDIRRKQQYAEEEHMNSEQGMYMEQDFDWDFQQGRR